MLAGSFLGNIEGHRGNDQDLPNHLSPSLPRSHLLQGRRYEDILCAGQRVRARLRRIEPVSVLVLELKEMKENCPEPCQIISTAVFLLPLRMRVAILVGATPERGTSGISSA